MANEISTIRTTGSPPRPLSRDLDTEVAIARNAFEYDASGRGPVVPAERAPSPGLRQAVSDRLRHMSASLDQRSTKRIARIVAEMLVGFGRKDSDAEVAATQAQYCAALADLPPWCVAEAANRFNRGLVVGHIRRFMPTTAELHAEALKIVQPWRDERARLSEILSVRVLPKSVSEAERARIADGLDKLREDLAASYERDKAEERARPPKADPLAPYRKPRSERPLEPSAELTAKAKELSR